MYPNPNHFYQILVIYKFRSLVDHILRIQRLLIED